MTQVAISWLCRLLTLIEDKGAPWPKATLQARAAFIQKPDTTDDDPLSYRVLSVLSVLYRTWAKVRLRNLLPWIRTWATEDLLASGKASVRPTRPKRLA